ncbi:VOC family protein [Nocardia fluminea]|uniref:VOC family protein n=1 Tax=Nocardia fluminea TaxID=134984 RepID=UPI003D0BD0DB
MHGEMTFFEIGVPDSTRAQEFYGRLFGWEFPPTGEGSQVWINTPTIKAGLHDQDAAARIAVFFSVEDLDTAVQTVRAMGGSADDPGPDEPGFGKFASCVDDQGVRFGLHQRLS